MEGWRHRGAKDGQEYEISLIMSLNFFIFKATRLKNDSIVSGQTVAHASPLPLLPFVYFLNANRFIAVVQLNKKNQFHQIRADIKM